MFQNFAAIKNISFSRLPIDFKINNFLKFHACWIEFCSIVKFCSFQINLDHFNQSEGRISGNSRPKIYFQIASQQMRLKQIVGGERLVVEWIGKSLNIMSHQLWLNQVKKSSIFIDWGSPNYGSPDWTQSGSLGRLRTNLDLWNLELIMEHLIIFGTFLMILKLFIFSFAQEWPLSWISYSPW